LGAGYPLTVYDLDAERVKVSTDQGALAAKNPGEVAKNSDIIILALPGSPAVDAVMQGKDGILAQLRAGQLVIDTGTSRVSTALLYDRLCTEKGAGFLDAPLTWRKPGQIIMVGGSAENYAKGEAVLKVLSYKLKHIGPSGTGQKLKAVNQSIQATRLAAYAECFEFCKMSDLDTRLIKDYLEFSDVPEAFYTDDFVGGGHLTLHYKDLLYALEIAHDNGAQMPLTSLVHEIFKAEWLHGDPRWFQLGIIHYWRRLNERRK